MFSILRQRRHDHNLIRRQPVPVDAQSLQPDPLRLVVIQSLALGHSDGLLMRTRPAVVEVAIVSEMRRRTTREENEG